MTTRVALLLFDGCDLLDVGGPYEVFLTAARLAVRRGDPPPFAVTTVSSDGGSVTAYGGLRLTPDRAAADLDAVDVVVVPGTIDVDGALADADLVALVAQLADRAPITTSLCTGAFLLAAAGVLGDRTATTHHEDVGDLETREDVGAVVTGRRWVDSGEIVTSAGLSSGISMTLHLVDRFAGRDLALATARQIEYAWDPDGGDMVS